MKILFHISSLYGGGAERVMSYLIRHYHDSENKVSVVVCYEHSAEYSIPSNVKKIVIGKTNIIKQSFILRNIIKDENPDICISFMQGGNIRLTLGAMFLNQKYILSIRNDPMKEYPNYFLRQFAKCFFSLADGVVFQTHEARNYFSNAIQNKSKIIYNPVSAQFFCDHEDSTASGIVSLGRLVKQKNFPFLIEAYSRICDKITDNLYIYGEGPLKKELSSKIKELKLTDRVFLMGRTNNSNNVLKNAKVFAMTSEFEGMPNALLEALCMKVPCVAVDCPCGGVKEIIGGELDSLIPSGDIELFSSKLLQVCTDEYYRMDIIKKECNIREKYRESNIFRQWDEYIDDVLNRGQR